MTKLRLIQMPSNPRRLLIQKQVDEGQWEDALITYQDEHLGRPLKTTYPDADPLIVQGMKVASGNPAGFPDWQTAAAFLDSIPDADAYAAALGHNLNDLLAQ